MNNFRFYLEFHKSTLAMSWSTAVALFLLGFLLPLSIRLFVALTLGQLLGLAYKEIASRNEYYFYYNRGVSKIKLISASLFFSGLTCMTIVFLCKVFLK